MSTGNDCRSPWLKALGIELSPVSHRERLASALGGFSRHFLVYAVSKAMLDDGVSPIMLFSMGSTAVMLFAVPHGPLSQPWPLLGGHLVSGLIGITCLRYIPSATLAGSLGWGFRSASCTTLRCLHPPAGATALAASLGNETVRTMGYGFVVAPLMLNVLDHARGGGGVQLRVFLAPLPGVPDAAIGAAGRATGGYAAISHEDFVYALTQMDSFIDVSEDDLLRIYELATGRQRHAADEARAARLAGPPFV